MLRTHTCGELRMTHTGLDVTLTGWVQHTRDMGGMTFIDLRDRYGITQLVFNMDNLPELCRESRKLGREYVIQVNGKVRERINKNPNLPTGDIEIEVMAFKVLGVSEIPPFTIENNTDGGDEIRLKFRYLDLRRTVLKENLILRHRMAMAIRDYLNREGFLEIETPFLIKSTPEGARDFVVPSRMNKHQFYALPQSPQIFKQLLMMAGYDKYFQLVKCFRDEDLRADRQPEFTQIDCEMSFVDKDDVLHVFEGMANYLFKEILNNVPANSFPRISYDEAMSRYGTDKPDIRFGMEIKELTPLVKGKGFRGFDEAEFAGAICAVGAAGWSRKQLDAITEFVRRPQVGAKGLIYVKYTEEGTTKSSVNKFFDDDSQKLWCEHAGANPGDLLLILAGSRKQTLTALSVLRLEMAERLGLREKKVFAPVWITDFPLFEWNEDENRFQAMHHPFTAPLDEDLHLLEKDPGKVRANAYDLVINGVEIGGGSIRIHTREVQQKMFRVLGFSDEEVQSQFGFFLEAFQYGTPPHGGIAFGFDRWVALFAGTESIREVIAFPKNNAGRDLMLDSPSYITESQLKELNIRLRE
ncbi:MAG: aspartate--tRNA ligase [Chlorobi bacterium]|nr:aspartate--tRNA ligase [Chlorobiota bacterium]